MGRRRRTISKIYGALSALLLLCCGCHRDASTSVRSVDLIEAFPFTESGYSGTDIDLGSGAANSQRLRGWSAVETLPSGEKVVRAEQGEAVLRFDFAAVKPRRLLIRCGLTELQRTTRAPRRAGLQLNGRRLGNLTLHEGLQEIAVDLPSDLQAVGQNILAIVQQRVSLARARRGAPKPLACSHVRIENTDGSVDVQPRLVGNRDAPTVIEMPAATQLTYFLRLPEAATLDFDVDGAAESQATQLSVEVERDSATAEPVWTGTAANRRAHVDLGKFTGAIVRLTLTAQGHGSVRLVQPRIVSPVVAAAARQAQTYRRAERPNVLFYLVDTLRSDHLSAYGYSLPTSPNIDALAADALLFQNMTAQASWTKPATASLMTGLYPITHGAVTLRDSVNPGAAMLAELLRADGYQTGAVVTNLNVCAEFGFRRGFDTFTYLPEDQNRPGIYVGSDVVNDTVFPWLAAHTAQPFLLYVHVTDPHGPYTPPEHLDEKFRAPGLVGTLLQSTQPLADIQQQESAPTPENVLYLQSLYDGEINFADRNFGLLIAELKRLNLYESTLIVVAADHGEEFFEHHGFEHGRTLYREMLDVPLVVRLPGRLRRVARIACPVRQIDVLPSILEALDIPPPPGLPGHSLLSQLDGRCARPETFAHTGMNPRVETRAFLVDNWKYIERIGTRGVRQELYDLTTDPRELDEIAARHPVVVGYATQAISRWTSSSQGSPTAAAKPTRTVSDEVSSV